MGSVPQLWLNVCHYQDGEEGAKGLVTSFFHLLDLEGEKEGLKQVAGEEESLPGSRLPPPADSPGGLLSNPHTHLCPQIPLPTTAAPAADSAAPSQRNAAQPSRQCAQRPGQCEPAE